MDLWVVYSKTAKGLRARSSWIGGLSSQLMRVLSLIDGKSNVATLMTQADSFTEEELQNAFTKLESDGYIRPILSRAAEEHHLPPHETSSPMVVEEVYQVEEIEADTLDFTNFKADDESKPKAKEAAEAKAREEAEAKVRAEAERKAKEEAERKAKEEAEAKAAAERQAKQEAEARAKAEAEAKAKEAAEAKAREEAEAKVRAEAERKAKEEAERKAKEEAEAKAAAERQAKQEAEARAKAEAEAKAKEAAEAKAREEAEAKVRAEAERKAKEEAERKAKEEAEAKAAAERQAKQEAEARAKAEAEAKAKEAAEAKAREEAEAKVRAEAERKAKEEAERKAKEEAEAKAAAERQAKQEAEARAKAEAEAKAKEAAEAKAREEAEAKVRAEAERKAKEEAERKAKEEAEAKAAAERQAKQEAEARAKAEAEAKAKEAAEAKAREEAEAKVRAEAERKAKEEAERKAKEEVEREAKEKATFEAESLIQQEAARLTAEPTDQEEAEAPSAPKPRKAPINIAKLTSIAAVSVLAAVSLLLVTLYFINLSGIIPIEKLASDKIHETVTVGSMRAALLPTPHFVLEGVKVSNAADVTIGAVRVFPVIGTLFEDTKTLRRLEIDSMTVPQESLDKVMKWMEASRGPGKLRLSHVSLRNNQVAVQGLQIPPFDAELRLDASDQLEGATLKSSDGNLSAELTPHSDRLEGTISATAWQPPIGKALVFDELNAKVIASRNGIKLVDIGGRIYGGAINGNATVGWDGPWTIGGDFTLSNASLSGISQAFGMDIALTGDLDMKASYSAKANDLPSLLNKPTIKASFTCRDGSVGSVDLARIVVQDTRGGSENLTRFDKLSGSMDLADGYYRFRQLKLIGGQLSAGGDIDLTPNQTLSGKINAEMAVQSRRFHAKLNLSGNPKQPQLK